MFLSFSVNRSIYDIQMENIYEKFSTNNIYMKKCLRRGLCVICWQKKLSALPLRQNYIGAKQLKRVHRVCNKIKNYI